MVSVEGSFHGRTMGALALTGQAGKRAGFEPLPGDQPGTIYLALSQDRQTAWLTALTVDGVLKLPAGKPAMIEAHSGTHSLPGHDPALLAYPRMSSALPAK